MRCGCHGRYALPLETTSISFVTKYTDHRIDEVSIVQVRDLRCCLVAMHLLNVQLLDQGLQLTGVVRQYNARACICICQRYRIFHKAASPTLKVNDAAAILLHSVL